MAGNLPVPQGVEVKLVWTYNGQDSAINVLHFSHSVGQTHTQARADSISSIYKAAFSSSALNAHIFSGVALARVESRHMDSNTDPWYIGAGAAVAGTGAEHPLPAATSFVITLRTGLRGRSYNGRIYIWGFTELANDAAGGITTAASAAAVSFIGTALGNMNTQLQLTQGVLSRWTTPPGSPPNTPPTERQPPIITPVVSTPARDARWDVQRRRATPGV